MNLWTHGFACFQTKSWRIIKNFCILLTFFTNDCRLEKQDQLLQKASASYYSNPNLERTSMKDLLKKWWLAMFARVDGWAQSEIGRLTMIFKKSSKTLTFTQTGFSQAYN